MDIILALAGIAAGFVTGYFFHYRATKDAMRHHEAIEEQFQALADQNEVLRRGLRQISAGFVERPEQDDPSPPHSELATAVRARALATQDASGRASRREVVAYFVQRGATAGRVERELANLAQVGVLMEEGQWLILR